MSLLQSNERSISSTDKSESGSLTASSASNAASTKVSESRLSTTPSGSNTNSTKGGVSTVAPTKTIVETATATVIKTTTATTTTTPQAGDAGFPISAITGLTVTSVVAIAALFAISGFLYRKRRRHQRVQPAPESSPEVLSTATTGFVGLPARCLLTGASDSEIKQQLSALGLLIRRHVDAHYHRDNITATLDTLHSSLRQLQLDEATCHKIARLSIDPNSRRVAIRHLLALVIFSNLDIHTVGSLSLLPPTVKEMSPSRVTALKEGRDSLDNLVETAWESWYRITAFLMHDKPKTRSPLLPPPSAKSQAGALIGILQEYLCHFVRRDDGHSIDDQLAGLAGVIGECVEFGYEVFSHPSDWEFIYTEDEYGVVVVPGLVKRSSNTGELYRPPEIILTPEIAKVKSLLP